MELFPDELQKKENQPKEAKLMQEEKKESPPIEDKFLQALISVGINSTADIELLRRTERAFPHSWHLYIGQPCQKDVMSRRKELFAGRMIHNISFITTGGVVSEAVTWFINRNTTYRALHSKPQHREDTAHLASPIYMPLIQPEELKNIVIMGDFKRATISMLRRGLLWMNVCKNLLAERACKTDHQEDFFLETFPTDPLGFKSMLWTFLTYPGSTIFLRAPYTKGSLNKALIGVGMADLVPQMAPLEVHNRTDREYNVTPALLDPYVELERILRNAPAVWDPHDPPPEVYQYLHDHFIGNE